MNEPDKPFDPMPAPVMHAIIDALMTCAVRNNPTHFRSFFIGAFIGNVVGNLPEDYWQEFIKQSCCDRPGCDCDKLTTLLIPALQAIRDDHIATLAKQDQEEPQPPSRIIVP